MKSIALALLAALTLSAGSVSAASYQMRDGTIVDPIKNWFGGDLAYSGPNLEPGANLVGANLSNADLSNADLQGADLRYADLQSTYLNYADLSNANLNYADLSHANLSNASLSDSNLSSTLLYSADFGGTASWLWATWTGAKYSINAVDHLGNPIPDTIFPTGMDQAWRDAAGVVAVPEPTTALLFGFGLPLIRTRIAATSLTRGIPCAAA